MAGVNGIYIVFYTAALLLSLTTFIYSMIQKRMDKQQNVLFFVVLGIVIVNSSTEIITEYFSGSIGRNNSSIILFKSFQFLYFLFHTALAPAFLLYELSVTGSVRRLSDKMLRIFFIPCVLVELLVIINPFTHWVYYYEDGYRFTRNWGEAIIYIVAGICIFVAITNIFHSWNAINQRRRIALLYFFGITLVGIVIQAVYQSLKTELFAESLALLGVMLAIESEDDRVDQDTRIYNRSALHQDVRNYEATDIGYTMICLEVRDMNNLSKKTGSLNDDKFNRQLSDFLKTLIPRYYIYNVSQGQYVLLILDKETKGRKIIEKLTDRFEPSLTVDEIVARIEERFRKPWEFSRISLKMDAVVVVAKVPEEVKGHDSLFELINSPIPKHDKKVLFNHEDLKNILRRYEVEKAVVRGLEEGNFEVYYQPTYDANTLKMHGAEALLRLRDKELGFIPPDEFIHVAEQIGMIDEIDDYVLREVSSFIREGILKTGHLQYINVNLSLLQFASEDFVEHISNIADEYGVNHSSINFEITESVEADDYDSISNAISELKSSGFMFSMDDYGTGYSNIRSSLSLDFDLVKIDKSILWGAEESEFGRSILENIIRMIKQTNRKIVVEGVETRRQVEMLRELDVDYLQGFYFSKPVPKKRFISMIEISRNEDREDYNENE